MSQLLQPSLYNTLTRRKEALETLEPGKVRIYSCGPTVYDSFHIGNARTFLSSDIVRRFLHFLGYEVHYVQNITDIDDKIINRAREQGVDPAEIAEKYTEVFFDYSQRLGIRPADQHPRATKYVGKMIGLIKKLEAKGLAYAADGDVFFRVRQFPEYGKLSGKKIEDLRSGARVEANTAKEDPLDFTLWKAAKPGEPSWKSPWGEGRPGWHLECSVMAMDLLGETFDIHMGGTDLCFPHHENEIAQSEGATGKPYVRYWLHGAFLNINQEKMSKSLGNFFTVEQILEKFDAPVLRYFLISAHYRAPLDFSDKALDEAATALGRLRQARATAARLLDGRLPEENADNPRAGEVRKAFLDAMLDDFNTPRALAALFDCAGRINALQNSATLSEEQYADLAALTYELDRLGGEVLGLDLAIPEAGLGDVAEQLIDLLIESRAMARKEKFYSLGDHIRDRLGELGFDLMDRPDGTEWRRKG